MRSWNVFIAEKELYVVTVEAETEEDAMEYATDKLEGNKHKYHNDSETDISATEI